MMPKTNTLPFFSKGRESGLQTLVFGSRCGSVQTYKPLGYIAPFNLARCFNDLGYLGFLALSHVPVTLCQTDL